MRIYSLPESTEAIIFDIDGTLYTNEAYVREQVDVQIRHWAEVTGISAQEARDRIAAYRKEWSARHGGKKISLGNTFTAFGVDIKTSIEWRNKIIEPERYLTEDPKLRAALGILSEKCRMVCVTNNPVDAAKRTLRALGVEDMLPLIVGLDTCMASKPSKDMLIKATELSCTDAGHILSVGDRYDIDLALPLEMGMGALLADGAEDIYALPGTLGLSG